MAEFTAFGQEVLAREEKRHQETMRLIQAGFQDRMAELGAEGDGIEDSAVYKESVKASALDYLRALAMGFMEKMKEYFDILYEENMACLSDAREPLAAMIVEAEEVAAKNKDSPGPFLKEFRRWCSNCTMGTHIDTNGMRTGIRERISRLNTKRGEDA